jgi:hypothetical protein
MYHPSSHGNLQRKPSPDDGNRRAIGGNAVSLGCQNTVGTFLYEILRGAGVPEEANYMYVPGNTQLLQV